MKLLIACTDGGSRGNPGDAAAAVFYPEGCGPNQTPFAKGKYIGKRTNNEAEYEALIMALEDALAHGYERLIVYSDSELMVNQMKGIYRVNAETIVPLYEKTFKLACQLDFDIGHIFRSVNIHADAECNRILDQHQGKPIGKVRRKASAHLI